VYSLGGTYAKYFNSTNQQIFIGNELTTLDYETNLNVLMGGGSAQISKNFLNDRLTLSAGLRTDFNNYSASMSNPIDQLSPRFSASYVLSDKWAVTANTGRYYQLPAYTTLGFRNNAGDLVNKENDLRYIGVNHFITGLQFIPREEVFFSIEGFYKQYNQYPFSVNDSISLANKGADYGVLGNEEVRSSSEGRAYGFEVLNRSKLPSGLNLIFSYTFVRSEFEDFKQELIPSSWDFRHIIVLTASQNLKKNWIAGIKWRFDGGLPYTPYDLEKSALISAWDAQGRPYFDFSRLNQLRLEPYHQLDLRVDKRYFFDRWSLMLYLDIQNVYNFKAKLQDDIVREKDANGNFITVDDNTKYILRGIQNTSGTVLPTIGIMVEF
jgi:hypothetical protein